MPHQKPLTFTAEADIIQAIQERLARERSERPGQTVSRSDVIRAAIVRGLGMGDGGQADGRQSS
jgi:hypothetical protein